MVCFANYKDMVAGGKMTTRMEGNKSRARFHGLIASIGEGEFVLTAKFLRGEPVPRVAMIDKVTGYNVGYWNESDTVTFAELMSGHTPFWNLSNSILDRALTSISD